MALVDHAERELRRAGLFDEDSDYEGALGEHVLALVKVFADQGHSGYSAGLAIQLFGKVARYETLTPLGNPTETGEYIVHAEDAWQSTRDGCVFSADQGKTWYHLDKYRTRLQRCLAWMRRHLNLPISNSLIRGRVV